MDITYVNDVLKFWKDNEIYSKILKEEQSNQNVFNFMDGPPFPNGMLHFGHLAVGAIKDTVLRYWRMHGLRCANKCGYDCHGLPIESVAMKGLNLSTNSDIEKMGIDAFNSYCKSKIYEFTGSWEPIYDQIGRWGDFQNVYKTMDTKYMESVWWVFSELYKKNLVYEGYKVMAYSWACETPISNFEAGQNYKEINTKSIYITFALKSDPNINLVSWTTTPWTLPSNLALCVNPSMNYVICTSENGKKYILSEESVNNVEMKFLHIKNYGKGSDLVGLEYIPLYDCLDITYHKIISDNYVKLSDEVGTGIVHVAPGFGNDDCRVCLDHNIVNYTNLDKVCPIDSTGKFTSQVEKYEGRLVFDTDIDIIKELKQKGNFIKTHMYKHNYPFCYRTETKLIYRAVSSLFVEVTKISNRMVELNKTITWSKKELGEKKFNNWIENTQDWGISRNRYFGTPIPVWKSDDNSEMIVVGSIEELVSLAKLEEVPTDLHKEFIDKIEIISPTTGNKLTRINDVFDCWFESGSVPFGQIHYPFENSNYFDNKEFLSDFICEGLDQTRGWFYTLLVLSTAILDKAPFKNVICSGLILDENGVKYSKKFGNFVDPTIYLNKYGADVMRLYFQKSPLINGDELWFNIKNVEEIYKKIIPYVNSVSFLLEHCENMNKLSSRTVNHISANSELYADELNITDKWILEQLSNLRISVENKTKLYFIDKAIDDMVTFIDSLTNWYLKLNRHRLKGHYGNLDREVSLSVLYTTIHDYAIISAPFMPFLSESIYQKLRSLKNSNYESVHQEQFPNNIKNYDISLPFNRLQKMCKLIRYIRDSSITHTSVKVPILKCTIYHYDQQYIDDVKQLVDLIQDEINCEEFDFKLISDDMITYNIKPNMKTLGVKYKKNAKIIKNYLESCSQQLIKKSYLTKSSMSFEYEDAQYVINPDEFDIIVNMINSNNENNIKTVSDNEMLVSADLTVSLDLMNKFHMKCFCKEIQMLRKHMGLKQWNNISLSYFTESTDVVNLFAEYPDTLSGLTSSFTFTKDICEHQNFEDFEGNKIITFNDWKIYVKITVTD